MFKKSHLLLALLFSMIAQLGLSQFSQIKEKKINQASLDKAVDLATKLLEGMKNDRIYLLTHDEATEAMIKGLTEEMQKNVYLRIKLQYGDFMTMQFTEALQPDNDKNLTIYRFRGNFESESENPEIRVVINKEMKLSGFWILPWKNDVALP